MSKADNFLNLKGKQKKKRPLKSKFKMESIPKPRELLMGMDIRRYKNDPRLKTALIAAAIGAVLFVVVYGFRVLIPTNIAWITEAVDLSQHYYGWEFYRSSSWKFPFGLTDMLGYPYITSVLFTDSIPLFAVFFKLISPILPKAFQYFGLWGIFCYALHGAVGALICTRYTNSRPQAILGCLFFVLSPVVLQRMYYHSALAAHWLIYLGILLLINRDRLKFSTALLGWGLLGALCASVHQYFLPMCGILCFGYMLHEIIKNKNWFGLLHGANFIAAALFVDYLLGAFSVDSQTGAWGLGAYSFNLNGLWNGQGYSRVFPNLPYLTDQHEGFAYIGFGVMALCVINIIVWMYLREKDMTRPIKAVLRDNKMNILIFGTMTVLCVIMAASPVVTFGEHVLFTIPLPEIVTRAWSAFRSTGRLVWPVIYFITVFLLSLLLKRKSKRLVIAALAICALFQFYDLSGTINARRTHYSKKYEMNLLSSKPLWSELGESKAIKHLILSNDAASPWERELFPFAQVAVENNWTLNDFYFARGYKNVSDYWKEAIMQPENDSVFVLSPQEYSAYSMAAPKELSFYEDGDFIVGLSRSDLISQTPMERRSAGYAFEFGDNANMADGEDIGSVRHLYPGGKSYGPYISISADTYEVTIEGTNLDLADIDATMDAGSTQLALKDFEVTPTLVTYKVESLFLIKDLETRVFNNSDQEITITSLTIAPVSE